MHTALEILQKEAPEQIGNLPFLGLQAVALIGVLAILLIVYRDKDQDLQPSPLVYGLTIGLAGYALTALVANFIQIPSKPYLRTDVLFLAGLLGGLRGGLLGGSLMILARYQFAGTAQFAAAVIDMAFVNLAGIAAHYWFGQRSIAAFRLREINLAWGMQVIAAFAGISLLLDSGLASNEAIHSVISRRALILPISYALFVGIFHIFRIDEEQRRARAMQAELFRSDPRTGLPNRQSLLEYLTEKFTRAPPEPATLVIIEASNYNDMILSEGLNWSDRLWREIDYILRDVSLLEHLTLRSPRHFLFSETALALVLTGITPEEAESQLVAAKLYQDINQRLTTLSWSGPAPQLHFGIVACDAANYPSADACLSDIGLRLQGLRNERQAIRYYHRGFADSIPRQRRLLDQLMFWIAEKSLPLAYQPKFELHTRRIVGAEALLRATDAEGSIPPGALLSIASSYQLLSALEWCTIEVAARDARRCMDRGHAVMLSVNVSGALLGIGGLAGRMRHLQHTLQLPAGTLTLELTENAPLPDTTSVRENIAELQEIGVELSLDDFGTGYSGLTVLARIPFSEVKIDSSMVALLDDERMHSAIELALESARRYGARFVAEGVETVEQSETLLAMGITIGQGYLFSRAIPIEELLQKMDRQETGLPAI